MAPGIELRNVTHRYGETDDSARVVALREVSLQIEEGAFVILMGASGSGKSTLLNLIGAVDRPSSGSVVVAGSDTASLSENELTLLRRKSLGYVFQFFHLLPTLSVAENIGFPLALSKVPRLEVERRVAEVLERVGLTSRAKHFPNQLSGGEMQRVAIGRAIAHRPAVILADEPTGNLDSATGESILELMREIHQRDRPTIVMATHSDRAASFGDYVLHVNDGRVEELATP